MEVREIEKQLNKATNNIEKIPFEYYYIEVKTKTDKYIIEKQKETPVIGFRGGE